MADDSCLQGKRILVVGPGEGRFAARIMYQMRRAVGYGVEIVLLGRRGIAPIELASSVIEADIGNRAACLELVERFHRHTPLNGVVSFSDAGSVLCAYIAQTLGLPGHKPDGTLAALEKPLMREAMRKAGIPSPGFAYIGEPESLVSAKSSVRFPAFLKLAAGGGSIAARLIEKPENLASGLESACREIYSSPDDIRHALLVGSEIFGCTSKPCPPFLLEDYLRPAESLGCEGLGRVTMEVVVQNGNIFVFEIADARIVSETDYRMASVEFPSQLDESHVAALRDMTEAVIAVLGLHSGPVIADAIITENGPHLFEVNARPDSWFILPLLERRGVDLVGDALRVAAGIPLEEAVRPSASLPVVAIELVMAPRAATIKALKLPESTPGVEVTVYKHPGEHVHGPEGAYDIILSATLIGPDHESVECKRRDFHMQAQVDYAWD